MNYAGIPQGNSPVAREIQEFWNESQSLWQQWQYEADLDTKLMTGQQDYFNQYYNVNYRNQRILQFNKLLRIKNMLEGYQRKNRLATIVIPADNDPDYGETADEKTTVLNWVKRQDATYEKISECFGGAVTCGLNLLSIWMDFREDPVNGTIRTTRLPFSSFIMSNYWEKSSLEDCDRILTRKYLTKAQVLSLNPDLKNELPLLGKGYVAKDGKFQYMAQNWYQYAQELYAYDEYWTRIYKKTRKILDRRTGEVIDWNGNKEQFEAFRSENPALELITAMKPSVKLNVLINNIEVYEEEAPYGLDRFPFVPFLCYHNIEVQNFAWRYTGVIRNARDAQLELNKRKNRLLDVLDAQIQSGLMVKEDALVNPEDAFFQGPGKILFFKNKANLGTDVAPIPSPPVAQGWSELIANLDNDIMSIAAMPEELFGEDMNAKDMSGTMMKLKMGAGLVGQQIVFDKLNESQMQVGEIMNELIVQNFTPGKIGKILGKEPTERFLQHYEDKYMCAVEEGQLTTTQRQLKFLQAMHFKQIMPDAVPDSYLLEESTLQGKKDLIEASKQREQQAAQMQQMQAQQAMQQQEILSRSIEAKAQLDFAGAEERKSKAVSEIAWAKESVTQGEYDRAKANLDNAKAMAELAHLPDERIMGLTQFILDMQLKQKEIDRVEEEDSIQKADSVGSTSARAEQESKPQQT